MSKNAQKIGWIGTGRMGLPMAERLLKAGHDVSIWNRTRAKAEPLARGGGFFHRDGRAIDTHFRRLAAGENAIFAEVNLF